MSVVVTLMMASFGSVMSGAGRVAICMFSLPCHSQQRMERVGSSLYLVLIAMLSDLDGGLTILSIVLWSLADRVCADGWSSFVIDMLEEGKRREEERARQRRRMRVLAGRREAEVD